MAGLASKWATDNTLVKKAIEQDKAVTIQKGKPLISRWATGESTKNTEEKPKEKHKERQKEKTEKTERSKASRQERPRENKEHRQEKPSESRELKGHRSKKSGDEEFKPLDELSPEAQDLAARLGLMNVDDKAKNSKKKSSKRKKRDAKEENNRATAPSVKDDGKTFEERQREFDQLVAEFHTSGNWADDEDF